MKVDERTFGATPFSIIVIPSTHHDGGWILKDNETSAEVTVALRDFLVHGKLAFSRGVDFLKKKRSWEGSLLERRWKDGEE